MASDHVNAPSEEINAMSWRYQDAGQQVVLGQEGPIAGHATGILPKEFVHLLMIEGNGAGDK